MSYCRFSDGDVYMYPSVYGGIECCSCHLAEKVPSIWTTGLDEDDPRIVLFGKLEPCTHCQGNGCDECMMPGNSRFWTRTDALNHLMEHRNAGDDVPEYAFERLKKELKEQGEIGDIELKKNGSPFFDLSTGENISPEEFEKRIKEE